MKYKERLSERIEEAVRLWGSINGFEKITEEQKQAIDDIESLRCEMCQGLYMSSNPVYDENTHIIIVELGNNKGNTLLLKLQHNEEGAIVEIECQESTEYYICPFRVVYKLPKTKPFWKNYGLEELQIPYGNDVILYKDGVPTVYIYTDVKCTKEMKEKNTYDRGRQELVPDYTIELSDRYGQQKEEITQDGRRQKTIIHSISRINGEKAYFPLNEVHYRLGQFEKNPSQVKERLCIEVADKCLNELIPERGKTKVRIKNK